MSDLVQFLLTTCPILRNNLSTAVTARERPLCFSESPKKAASRHHQEQLSDCRTLQRGSIFPFSNPVQGLSSGRQKVSNVHQNYNTLLWTSLQSGSSALTSIITDTQTTGFRRFSAQFRCRGHVQWACLPKHFIPNNTSPYTASFPLFEEVHPAVIGHSGNFTSRRTREQNFTQVFTYIRHLFVSKDSKFKQQVRPRLASV